MTEHATAMPTGTEAVSFAETFVSSDAFRDLFREGMGLVEETASYLDGPGREESKALPRLTALAYATESMRLTTRLMQLASWLLLQRAVGEGELSREQAERDKTRINLTEQPAATAPETFDALPAAFRELVSRSLRLQSRILHLDRLIASRSRPAEPANPVSAQLDRLRSAFGG
jgi:regulator of CtrA degradation